MTAVDPRERVKALTWRELDGLLGEIAGVRRLEQFIGVNADEELNDLRRRELEVRRRRLRDRIAGIPVSAMLGDLLDVDDVARGSVPADGSASGPVRPPSGVGLSSGSSSPAPGGEGAG